MVSDQVSQFLRGDFSSSVYVQRARDLVPTLKERSARQWNHPRVLDETIQDMLAAGFFQMFQPKRWGGGETTPRVPGGFILNGRWGFSSGSDHCAWTFLGGHVEDEARGPGPATYTFLLPRADYEIVHNWNVTGLRSTGSNDLIVKDAFIPEHRALRWDQIASGQAPGMAKNTGLMYRIPFFQIFSRATQPPAALGALKGMVDAFIDFNSGKVSRQGIHIGQNPEATAVVSESLSHVEEMKSQVYKNYARLIAEIEGVGPAVSMDDRRKFRFQAAQIAPRCASFANELFRISGGHAIYEQHAFGRYLNDLMAIQTHQLCNYQLNANAWAGPLLGYADAAKNYAA